MLKKSGSHWKKNPRGRRPTEEERSRTPSTRSGTPLSLSLEEKFQGKGGRRPWK